MRLRRRPSPDADPAGHDDLVPDRPDGPIAAPPPPAADGFGAALSRELDGAPPFAFTPPTPAEPFTEPEPNVADDHETLLLDDDVVELIDADEIPGIPLALLDVRDNVATVLVDPASVTFPALVEHEAESELLEDVDFWAMYDEARAVADLLDVPPTSTVAVIGSLEVAMPAARRCRNRHWIDDDDVFVLTDRPDFVDEPSWHVITDGDELVDVLAGSTYPSAMLVIDVPGELPRTLKPLVHRLREAGLALVRYVLDGSPTDEDLATWHGELGRPSALDLAGTVEPTRVLELLDRAEPIASIAGVPISPELILALRLDALAD
ncbi:MAG: hypothetical protein AAF962_20665 [Actinomycetota bacterium]